MARFSWASSVPLIVALAIVTVAAVSGAHNPALTVYEPAPLDGGLLVLGEEGTAALVTPEGETRWQEATGVHVLQAPVVAGDVAATLARNVSTLVPEVLAFNSDGLAWRAPVGDAGELGALGPGDSRFLALTDGGALTLLDTDGQVLSQASTELAPAAAPVALAGGHWAVATQDGRILRLSTDGTTSASAELPHPATTLRHVHGHLVAGFASVPAKQAGLQALDADTLSQAWTSTVPGVRVGGEPAELPTEVVFATYRPSGAQVVALHADGSPSWEHDLGDVTAAAAATDGQRVLLATTNGVQALSAEGEPLWNVSLDVRLVSPVVHHGLVLPSGADDRLVALDPATGEQAWTWSDGVSSVPWTDEGLRAQGPPEPPDEAPGPLPLVMVLAAAVVARAQRGRR